MQHTALIDRVGRQAMHAVSRIMGSSEYTAPPGLRIDLGCGPKKRAGFVGVDMFDAPGVDHIVDVEREPLPFADSSVGHLYSAHCVEHLREPTKVFRELTRVTCDRGLLEIWVPYVWHSDMWLPGHISPISSELYLHLGHHFRDVWAAEFGASWRLLELTFVTRRSTLARLALRGIGPGFAIRHLHDVCHELGALVQIEKTSTTTGTPRRYWAFDRDPRARIPLWT